METVVLASNIKIIKQDEHKNPLEIIRGVSLCVQERDIYALIGPSGSGKSSLLRLFNRLEDPTSGEVYIEGREIRDWDIRSLRSTVGFVFQESALFQGTVMDNVLYGPRIRGIKKAKEKEVVKEVLQMVGLEQNLMERDIEVLSGGQKQRVNIARTLALKPDIILMDEPTASLDPASTRAIENLIKDLNENYRKTIVLVSHDMRQVERIATRGALLVEGRVVYEGTPEQIFRCSTDEKLRAFFQEVK